MKTTRVVVAFMLLIAVVATFLALYSYGAAAFPYQDPTPELLIEQQREMKNSLAILVGSAMAATGAAVFLWKTRSKLK